MQPTPRSEIVRSDNVRSADSRSTALPPATPGSLSALQSASMAVDPPAIPQPRRRAIDVVHGLKRLADSASVRPSIPSAGGTSQSALPPSLSPRCRAVDLIQRLSSKHRRPAAAQPAEVHSQPETGRKAAKRRRSQSPQVDIDLTMDSCSSDDEERPPRRVLDEPELVYNTNDILATRQTIRGWSNSSDPSSWILSREELHSDQVDLDRLLPGALEDFPSFVS